MKRFLKKANRGLLLGGFALILLVIYVIIDYSGFSDEQPKIKEAVENYIGDFYERLSEDDYAGICELVDNAWDSEPVMMDGYYEDKESLSHFFETQKSEKHKDEYGESSCNIQKLKVSKAGPGMAKATINYTANIEYGCSGEYLSPFESNYSGWYMEEENNKRYIYEVVYEVEVYLRKIDGNWKLIQADCWETDFMHYEKEGE